MNAQLWKTFRLGLMVCLAALILPCSTRAQDTERLGPKEVPKGPGAELRAEGQPAEPDHAGDAVLIKELVGLVFLNSPGDVKSKGATAEGVQLPDLPLPIKAEFLKQMQKYISRPLTESDLRRIIREVIVFYRKHDRPVVDVALPEQDITSGVVQFVVLEGKLGEVRARGNRWFKEKAITSHVRTQPGQPIHAGNLMEDVDWLNRNPFRQVEAVLTPGRQAGTTDIVMEVSDRRPYRVFAGFENSGNKLAGEERVLAGFNLCNLPLPDHRLNYQFTASTDFDRLRAHSLSYVAPLPWRHLATVFGSLAESDVASQGFDLGGTSAQLGLRYEAPLPSLESYHHSLIAGFDWKRSDTDLEFGVIRVTDTTTEIAQLLLGYEGRLKDSFGLTSFGVELFHSPGKWFAHQSKEEYEAVRAGADPDFTYIKFDMERTTRLPRNFTLSNELVFQWAETNLLPSEQLGFGGDYSVRGFDPRAVANSDQGGYIRNELRTPSFSPAQILGVGNVRDAFQFLVFYDYGVAERRRALAGEDSRVTMSAFGPGVRYSIAPYVELRADYGIVLQDAGLSDQDHRWHVGLLVSF